VDELMAKLEDLVQKVESKVQELTRKINGLLSHIPSYLQWVVGKVEGLWNTFCSKMAEVWAWLDRRLPWPGNPFRLHSVGLEWNTKLGQPTHKRAGDIDSDELLVDDSWTGTSAEGYKSHIGDQQAALTSVAGLAGTVMSAMNTMKTGIFAFWAGIVVGFIALLGGIVGAVTATGTVVGIPVGVALGIAAVAAFAAAAAAAELVLWLTCNDARDSINTAVGYADSWPKFAVTV
jgi:hypothetical protein